MSSAAPTTALTFQVRLAANVAATPQTGRLLIALSHRERPEPRTTLGDTGPDAPLALACDIDQLAPGATISLDQTAYAFPITNLAEVSPGNYFVQALLDSSRDLRSLAAPGNLYSDVERYSISPAQGGIVRLELTHRIPEEAWPADGELVKFIKFPSPLLSRFHGRPIYLRAGVILPRDYDQEPGRRYPLWVRIGGYGTRFTAVSSLMSKDSTFRKIWLANDTPRMILLQLDGAGPYGDPYQINSPCNGPYGDAITQELIPYVEAHFRALGRPSARVLSGVSTGGWASLALQIFYPDYFNGTWSSCPDPVDFRAFELVNIYQDTNAYVNPFGNERPSERTVTGEIRLTMRHEVGLENLRGRRNRWTLSGEQWGAWAAAYGPRLPDGEPAELWDPQTGQIDPRVAEAWKGCDLRLVLEQNWPTLGPKLRGKLRIAVGDADNYYLNNAVHLLDHFLSQAQPPYEGRIVYGPGQGHGWSDVSLKQMLVEMAAATGIAQ